MTFSKKVVNRHYLESTFNCFLVWLKVKVTTQGQRSQTLRCVRSLNASFFIFSDNRINIVWKKKIILDLNSETHPVTPCPLSHTARSPLICGIDDYTKRWIGNTFEPQHMFIDLVFPVSVGIRPSFPLARLTQRRLVIGRWSPAVKSHLQRNSGTSGFLTYNGKSSGGMKCD